MCDAHVNFIIFIFFFIALTLRNVVIMCVFKERKKKNKKKNAAVMKRRDFVGSVSQRALLEDFSSTTICSFLIFFTAKVARVCFTALTRKRRKILHSLRVSCSPTGISESDYSLVTEKCSSANRASMVDKCRTFETAERCQRSPLVGVRVPHEILSTFCAGMS